MPKLILFVYLVATINLFLTVSATNVNVTLSSNVAENELYGYNLCWVIIESQTDGGYDFQTLAYSYIGDIEDAYQKEWFQTIKATYMGCQDPDYESDYFQSYLNGSQVPLCSSNGFLNNTTRTSNIQCDLQGPGNYSMVVISDAFEFDQLGANNLDDGNAGTFGATVQGAVSLIEPTNVTTAIGSAYFTVDAFWDMSCEELEVVQFRLPVITSADGTSEQVEIVSNLEYETEETIRDITCFWIITPEIEGGRSDGGDKKFDSVWLTVSWPNPTPSGDAITVFDANYLNWEVLKTLPPTPTLANETTNTTSLLTYFFNETDNSTFNSTYNPIYNPTLIRAPPDRESCVHDSEYKNAEENACYIQSNFPLMSTNGSFVVMFTSSRSQEEINAGNNLDFSFSFSFEGAYCLDPLCNSHGTCVNGQCECETGWRGTSCTMNIPDAWVCEVDRYNTSDGCDCSCQAHDPDCKGLENNIKNCSTLLELIENPELINYGAIEDESIGFCLHCPLEILYTSEDYPVVETEVCSDDDSCNDCDFQTGFCIIDPASNDVTDAYVKFCDSESDCPSNMYCVDGMCYEDDEEDDSTTGSVGPITLDAKTCYIPFTIVDWAIDEGSCDCDGVYGFEYDEAFDLAEKKLKNMFENIEILDDSCAYMSPFKAVISTISQLSVKCQLVRFSFTGFEYSSLSEASFAVFDVMTGANIYDAVTHDTVAGWGGEDTTFSNCLSTGRYLLQLKDSGGDGWGGGNLTVEGDGFELARGTVLVDVTEVNFTVCNDAWLEVTFTEETGAGSTFTFVDANENVVVDLLGVEMSGILPGTCTQSVTYSYCLPSGSRQSLTAAPYPWGERFQYWNFKIKQKSRGLSTLKHAGMLEAEFTVNCSLLVFEGFDSSGDGWDGYEFSLFDQETGLPVQTGRFL